MKKLICLSASFIIIIVLHAQVTIENLLSAPFPSELKSSPDGKHIAWVFNNKGVRNIFIADAPSFAPRQITKHISDDGIDISDLNFSAEINIFFSRKAIQQTEQVKLQILRCYRKRPGNLCGWLIL